MATYTEPSRPYACVLSECTGTLSRENVVIVSGAGPLPAGSVLGKVTASGKYKLYDNTAVDGTQTATAVLLVNVDATAAEVNATVISRIAEVKTDSLNWHANNDAAAKTAGIADLALLYIIAR